MMTNSIELPKNSTIAKQVIDDRHRERGLLGKIFGSKEHAPTNIVGLVVIVSFISILALVILQAAYPEAKVDRSEEHTSEL